MATEQPTVLRTMTLVILVACGAAVLVAATHEWSRDRIAANERQRLLGRLRSVVERLPDAQLFEPIEAPIEASESDATAPTDAFLMVVGDEPRALVLAATAPDGYNAPIRLLVGIDVDGTVTGVRVIGHRETPGLGDAIEIAKSNWIEQFVGTSLSEPAIWSVDKDGGTFDSLTGATVTPRAVVAAVHRTLQYYASHREELMTSAQSDPSRGATDE